MEASFKKSYASLGADRLVLLWLGVWWIANLVQAGFTELANDEAYYHMFAERLAWGYFDHPPVTALLVWAGERLFGGELGVRFFFTVLQPLYLWILWRLIRPADAGRRDAALFVVGVSAWYLLRRREQLMARRSIAIASAFGFVFALVTAFTGDRSGAIVARVQPMKLAAMEALYDGQQGAPLTAVGILRPEAQRTGGDAFYFRIDIPKMLSLMSFRSADAFVPGINDLVYGNEEYGVMPASEKIERGRVAVEELGRYCTAREKGDTAAITEIEAKFDRSTPQGAEFLREHFAYFGYGYLDAPQDIVPDVPLLFYSFRVMVGAGVFFILLLALVWWLNRRGRLENRRWLLWVALWSIPLAYIASQAGWIVAEVGRQPWAIQNLLPVSVSASRIGSGSVATTFFLFLALFTVLLAAEIGILCKQIKIGPDKE